MGADYTTLHAADLLAQLPEGARTWRAYDGAAVWTSDRTLMAAVINDLNFLAWARTKDGRKGRNRPRLVGPFEEPGRRRADAVAMTREELDARLSMPRRAIPDGQH